MKLIKSIFTGDWEGVKQSISNIVNAIKNFLINTWNAIKTALSSVMTAIKNVISGVWDRIGDSVMNVVNKIKSFFSSAWDGIKTTASKAWNEIFEKITSPIRKAQDTIKGIVDKIKGFFNFTVSLPKIKLPHFSIKPSGWKIGDLLEGSIPSLGIEWYAKAMKNPMVMTKPTVFGYNAETGKLQAGGEAGAEVVSGAGTLMGMISAAVASQNEALVYAIERIIEILAVYFPQLLEALDMDIVLQDGVLVGRLAPKMNEELGRISARKDRGR